MTSVLETSPGDGFAAPDTPDYRAATEAYNLAAVLRPSAATTVSSIDELRAALAAARASGRRVRVLTTGHGADAAGPMEEEVLIRLAPFGPVRVDDRARTAIVPAGVRWREVIDAAAPFGLAALHGSSSTVGAIGYVLGGGMSFYGRKHGLAAGSVLEIELMTADGELLHVGPKAHPELFAALLGGGGGFGVVTAALIELVEVPGLQTGAAFWPAQHLDALLERWVAWSADAPDEITTSFRVMNLPPLPGVPPVLTTGPMVCVDGAATDGATTTGAALVARLLGALGAVAEPLLDTWHPAGPGEVPATHMDPPDPAPYVSDHLLLAGLPADAQRAFTTAVRETAAAGLAIVELRQLGGAFGRPSGDAVLDRVRGEFSLNAFGILAGPDAKATNVAGLAALRAALEPSASGYTFPNFVSGWDAPQATLDDDEVRRVNRIRRQADPDGLFSGGVSTAAREREEAAQTD